MDLKIKLISHCISLLEEKLQTIDQELDLIQKSANEETKSSAGDKYETGRAMLMLEKEKFINQKETIFQQLKPLKSIDPTKNCQKAELGALVYTNSNTYFISSGIGQVTIDAVNFFVVSAMSPIAQAMLGKEKGESFSFGRVKYSIERLL